jgi:hypothetical protein
MQTKIYGLRGAISYKKVYNLICRLFEFSWQGRQFWNQTLGEEVEKVDIQKIHILLNEDQNLAAAPDFDN